MSELKITFDRIMWAVDQVVQERHDDIRLPEWAARKTDADNYNFGCCYFATEAVLRLSKIFREQNPDIPDLKACFAKRGEDNHYWLVNKKTGEIHDVTATQFAHGQFAGEKGRALLAYFYETGKGRGLPNVSNPARMIMTEACKTLGVSPALP